MSNAVLSNPIYHQSGLTIPEKDTFGQVRSVIACQCVFEGSSFDVFSSTSMKLRSYSKPKMPNFAEDTRIPRQDFRGYTHSWETSAIGSFEDSSEGWFPIDNR